MAGIRKQEELGIVAKKLVVCISEDLQNLKTSARKHEESKAIDVKEKEEVEVVEVVTRR